MRILGWLALSVMMAAGICGTADALVFNNDHMAVVKNGTIDEAALAGWIDAGVSRDVQGRVTWILESLHANHSPEYAFTYYGNTATIKAAVYTYPPGAIREVYGYNSRGALRNVVKYANERIVEKQAYQYAYYGGTGLLARASRTVQQYYYSDTVSGRLSAVEHNVKFFYKNQQVKCEIATLKEYDVTTGKLTKYLVAVTSYDRTGHITGQWSRDILAIRMQAEKAAQQKAPLYVFTGQMARPQSFVGGYQVRR